MTKPKKEPNRTHRVEVQYSDIEYAEARERAHKAGYTQIAPYVRDASLQKEIREALTKDDMERIDRANAIPYTMQVNLNQIARLGNVHGVEFVAEAVGTFMRKFEQYIGSGNYEPMSLTDYEAKMKQRISQSDEVAKLKSQLADITRDRDEWIEEAKRYYMFTREGEGWCRKQYNFTTYPSSDGFDLFIKVGDEMAYKLPPHLTSKYYKRQLSICDLYRHWLEQQRR